MPAICQTRDGYLWIATSNGLVRYDGLNFTVFNSSNTPGIESNRFNLLYEDDQGALWIGTEDGGLIAYQERTFRTVIAAGRLPNKLIKGIYKDEDGALSVFTNAGGPIRVTNAGATDFAPREPLVKAANAHYQADTFWYRDGRSLRLLSKGSWKSFQLPEGLSNADITSVHQDRQGDLWIVSRDLNLIRIGSAGFNT